MDIGSRSPQILEALLTRRHLLLQGEVDSDIQFKINRFILYLNSLDESPITLFIDTGGGNMELGLCISDSIEQSQAEIRGVVIGDAFSTGFRILQTCHKRLAYPNARLMFHAPSLNHKRCDADDWDEHCKLLFKLQSEQLQFFAERSKQPINQLKEWSRKEKRFNSKEALDAGFLDGIIVPPKK